ncbi:MAG: diacylglycerol/polyprenol kinase family protein [Bacillota bacterium]
MIGDVTGMATLMVYYLVFLILLPTLLKIFGRVPTELVRKIQHVVYSFSVFILLEMFSAWYLAIMAAFLLAMLAYPVLIFAEKNSWYKKAFVDRTAKGGELRQQLVYVQLSFTVLIFIFWGLLGSSWHYVMAVAVMAWGFGDAAAALVGKAFGRRRIHHRLIDAGKTYEGTGAMVLFAGLAIFFTLWFYAGKPWYTSLFMSIMVAPVCGIVELFSRRGTDTLTVPLSAALMITPLVHLFSL